VGLESVVLLTKRSSERGRSAIPTPSPGGAEVSSAPPPLPPSVVLLKHYGPDPHPGTGTPQSVHGYLARSEGLGMDRQVANEIRRSYVFQGGKVVKDQNGLPKLTPEGEARAERVAKFVEEELAKRGASEYETQSKYGVAHDGLATDPNRRAMQMRIIDKYWKSMMESGAEKGQPPQLIVTGGLGGAGKTRLLREQMGLELVTDKLTGEEIPKGYIVINPDIFKGLLYAEGGLPKVPGLTPGEASVFAHEEASALAKYLSSRAQGEGYNVVWDFTMGSAESTLAKIHDYTDPDGPQYETSMVFVDITPERSVESANKRWHGGNVTGLDKIMGVGNEWKSADYGDTFMGRYVPASFVMNADGKNKAAFLRMMDDYPAAVAAYAKKIGAESVPELTARPPKSFHLFENRWDEAGKRRVDWVRGTGGKPPKEQRAA